MLMYMTFYIPSVLWRLSAYTAKLAFTLSMMGNPVSHPSLLNIAREFKLTKLNSSRGSVPVPESNVSRGRMGDLRVSTCQYLNYGLPRLRL